MAPAGDVPYGKRLVPVLVDEIAAKDPERTCFSFPRSTNLADGFHDMNFRTVCAWPGKIKDPTTDAA